MSLEFERLKCLFILFYGMIKNKVQFLVCFSLFPLFFLTSTLTVKYYVTFNSKWVSFLGIIMSECFFVLKWVFWCEHIQSSNEILIRQDWKYTRIISISYFWRKVIEKEKLKRKVRINLERKIHFISFLLFL
jgi:hypothetical protein